MNVLGIKCLYTSIYKAEMAVTKFYASSLERKDRDLLKNRLRYKEECVNQ